MAVLSAIGERLNCPKGSEPEPEYHSKGELIMKIGLLFSSMPAFLTVVLFACFGCTEQFTERTNVELSRDEAARMSARADNLADYCEVYDWYGDGVCDDFCLEPDPDCDESNPDWCDFHGLYDDDDCEWLCPEPDPGCDGLEYCAHRGHYGDGYCDSWCPEPDPDCGDAESDECERQGFYGDGICSPGCPQVDPDCVCHQTEDGHCQLDCPQRDPDCGCHEVLDEVCDPDCAEPDLDCACHEARNGWCDPRCPQPDPDCAGPTDECAEHGYYDDGRICHTGCPLVDPDCLDCLLEDGDLDCPNGYCEPVENQGVETPELGRCVYPDCDGSPLVCDDVAPTCPVGQTPAVLDGCWVCVDARTCEAFSCVNDLECPNGYCEVGICQYSDCSDGSELLCHAEEPECPTGFTVAVVQNCYVCANARTCQI